MTKRNNNRAPGISLTDQLSLVLLRFAPSPVALGLILKELEDRGVETSASTVVQSLSRNPERFIRTERGFYGLNLGKDLPA